MAHYRSRGVDVVVSMLEPGKAGELGPDAEEARCRDAGMMFMCFPIRDRGLPDQAGFGALIATVTDRLEAGQGVAVHCRAGIGRSGMLVCCVLAPFVGSAARAVDLVTRCRGVPVPDTAEQRAFIESIVRERER